MYGRRAGPPDLLTGSVTGTSLASMMSVIGLPLPEMILLHKVIRIRLPAIVAGILFIPFTLTGCRFSALPGKFPARPEKTGRLFPLTRCR